jgi:hypothetical protein
MLSEPNIVSVKLVKYLMSAGVEYSSLVGALAEIVCSLTTLVACDIRNDMDGSRAAPVLNHLLLKSRDRVPA